MEMTFYDPSHSSRLRMFLRAGGKGIKIQEENWEIEEKRAFVGMENKRGKEQPHAEQLASLGPFVLQSVMRHRLVRQRVVWGEQSDMG